MPSTHTKCAPASGREVGEAGPRREWSGLGITPVLSSQSSDFSWLPRDLWAGVKVGAWCAPEDHAGGRAVALRVPRGRVVLGSSRWSPTSTSRRSTVVVGMASVLDEAQVVARMLQGWEPPPLKFDPEEFAETTLTSRRRAGMVRLCAPRLPLRLWGQVLQQSHSIEDAAAKLIRLLISAALKNVTLCSFAAVRRPNAACPVVGSLVPLQSASIRLCVGRLSIW